MVKSGDAAPDIWVFSPGGTSHQLAETWQSGFHALKDYSFRICRPYDRQRGWCLLNYEYTWSDSSG